MIYSKAEGSMNVFGRGEEMECWWAGLTNINYLLSIGGENLPSKISSHCLYRPALPAERQLVKAAF